MSTPPKRHRLIDINAASNILVIEARPVAAPKKGRNREVGSERVREREREREEACIDWGLEALSLDYVSRY